MNFLIFAALSIIINFFGIRNARVPSFQRKFIGLTIKWWMSFVYILLTIIFTVCWAVSSDITSIVFFILMLILSFITVTFSLKELLYYLRIFECCNVKVTFWKFSISLLTMIYAICSFVLV